MEHEPKIITTALGDVEASTLGSGPVILVLHGSPSGIDGSIAMSRFLSPDKFRTICLSRPGYLKTPLSSENPSIDHEADLLAALLDSLNVDRVGVLAWSGGGGSAYRFAVRHPHRVSALVTIAAVSSRWIAPKPSLGERFLFGTSVGNRLVSFLTRHAQAHLIEEALQGEGSVRGEELRILAQSVMADEAQRRLILETAPTMNTSGERAAGWQNDVRNYAAIDDLELGKVQCPTLIIHGDADTDAIPEYSRTAHAAIPNSKLVMMERGTHLSFYAHPEANNVQEQARAWFLDHQ